MQKLLYNPLFLFLIAFSVIFSVLFFIPISIFDAEIIFNDQISEWTVPTKMNLKNALGFGLTATDLEDVKDFYVTGKGYFLIALLTIALPVLITYRIRLAQKQSAQKKVN